MAYIKWDSLREACLQDHAGQQGGEPTDCLADQPTDELVDAVDQPVDQPMGELADAMDQYCSGCNQKKSLLDFGHFLTCDTCRRRNKNARHRKRQAKEPIIRPQATREQIKTHIESWSRLAGERELLRHRRTRPLTIDNYLE
jgi:hypothetical protein